MPNLNVKYGKEYLTSLEVKEANQKRASPLYMQDMLSKYWIHLQSQYVIVDANGL